jgi:hypothetical protein
MSDEIKNRKNIFNIDLLKRKNTTKSQPSFNIQLNNPIKKDEKEEKEEEDEKEESVSIEKKEEIEGIELNPHQKPLVEAIKFTDKRKHVEIDRSHILARLNTSIGIVEKRNKLSSSELYNIPRVDNLYKHIESSIPEPPSVESESILKPHEPPAQPKKIKKKLIIREEPTTLEKKEKEPTTVFQEEQPIINLQEEELPDELPEDELLEEEKKGEEEKEEEKEAEPVIVPEKSKRGRKKKVSSEEAKKQEEESVPVEIDKKGKKKRISHKKTDEYRFGEQSIDPDAKINRKLVINRLPKHEKLTVKTSNYYMNNRKLYIQKIAELFKPYNKELLDNIDKSSCDSVKTADFKLLTHQKVVRDYLNLYTPYRGLLIYHMLGSGKTCTSIAIAEGMKSQRPIILMTPASLKTNFFYELKKCGDLMYRRNQYWEFIQVGGKPEYVDILSKVLLISRDVIQKNGGAWLVDVTNKTANFNDLSSEDQNSIDQQIDMMIRSKYLDINYNGLNKNILNEMTDELTKNPFDNATVIIDEAHNFVSRIVNKLKKPKTISYILYQYLMKATNVKIVLVSGTPIINYPNELGILFNILRGYIKKWTFQLRIRNNAPAGFKLNREEIQEFFKKEGLNTYDYIEFSGNNLIITRNPFGFINADKNKKGKGPKTGGEQQKNSFDSFFGGKEKRKTKKIIFKNKKDKKNISKKNKYMIENNVIVENKNYKDPTYDLVIEEEATIEYQDRINEDIRKGGDTPKDYIGVTLDETGNITDQEFVNEIKKILSKHHIDIVESGSSYEEIKSLPDDKDIFLSMFVDQDNTVVKNENTLKKRILGLSSYFRSTSETLMPQFVKTTNNENYHIVPIEMSEYQFANYEKIRKEEIESEKAKRKNNAKKKDNEAENVFEMSSTYRIFSRAVCNFAFPNPPGRPMPSKKGSQNPDVKYIESLIKEYAEENEEDKDEMSKEDFMKLKKSRKLISTYISTYKSLSEKLLEFMDKFSEDEKSLIEEKVEVIKSIFEKISKDKTQNLSEEDKKTLDEIFERFKTLLEKIGHIQEEVVIEETEDAEAEWDELEKDQEEDAEGGVDLDGKTSSVEYQERIKKAMNLLKNDPEKTPDEQYLTKENLKVYSPKFLRVLENIQDPENKGLHLLYSQFRTIEGIGVLKLVLESNGYAEFKIKKNDSNGLWDIVENEEDRGKPRFVLYTGTETVEQKEIIRNIYNSAWEVVPNTITAKLREISSNNFYGEIIKLLMITSSGAEGINLKNTRFVHIVEPYWHMVRLEQVIGRARRICSHNDLPEEERTVKVFLYLSVFSEEQKTNKKNIELMNTDVSRITNKPITTDESLYDTASIKQKINNQLLKSIKEVAIDCSLYNPYNKDENLVCYNYGKVTSNDFASYPDINQDLGEMDEVNVKKTKLKLKASQPINGVVYAIDPKTMDAYDMNSYKEAQEGRGQLLNVGKIVKLGTKFTFVPS